MIKAKEYIRYLLYLFIIHAVSSCSFSENKSRSLLENSKIQGYDIIIVPGVPFNNTRWSSTMKARIYWAKYLYQMGITKNIMFSGSSVYSPYYEAEIMALYAEAIGIPHANIFTETKAEHSTENIFYGYHKARNSGFTKVALATDPFQAKQLKSFINRRISRNIGIIPIVFDSLKLLEPAMIEPEIDYQKAYNKTFKSIKDRESLWKRFKGTLGWNIDKTAYQKSD